MMPRTVLNRGEGVALGIEIDSRAGIGSRHFYRST
jgi:hypothetical protein